MNFLKKNQILLYVIAFMLVTAGYLNYTTKDHNVSDILQTTTKAEELAGTENIGDARLVSSQVNETTEQNNSNTTNEINPNQNSNTDNTLATTSDTASTNSTEEGTNSTSAEESTSTNENTSEGGNATKTTSENSNNNIENNEETKQTTAKVSDNDYFSKSKLERDTMYSQTLETYQKMLDNSNVSEEQKAIVTQEITKLNQEKNAIMICENVLSTKGFNKCVIFVNVDSISVVVGKEKIETDEIAQIQNIVSREMNAKVENIHILRAKQKKKDMSKLQLYFKKQLTMKKNMQKCGSNY